MPRGRKPKALKNTKVKGKEEDSVSAEVRDIFFNADIKDEEDVLEAIADDVVEEIAELEDPVALVGDPEVPKEVEAPETISISEGGVGDSETFMVVSSYSDDGDELQTIQSIRGNKPPEVTWADKHSKFVTGQKIMPTRLTKEEIKNFECARVISPGSSFDTYCVKMSRSMNEIVIKGFDWMLASEDCKPYVSYWDAVSPVIKMRKI